jgi:hypothetical protein
MDAIVFTRNFWKLMQLYSPGILEIDAIVFTRNFWKLMQLYSPGIFGN